METRLSITIEANGDTIPAICSIIGQHNSGKQKTDLMAIDMFLFRIKDELPGTKITTKRISWQEDPFYKLEVMENGVLVAILEVDEVWQITERNRIEDVPTYIRQRPLTLDDMESPIAN